MEGFVFLVVALLVGLGFLIAWGVRQERARIALWRAVAARWNLALPRREIIGTHDGVAVRVNRESRGSGKNQRTVTVIRMQHAGAAGLPTDLTLGSEGFFSRALVPDDPLGDPDFDYAVRMKGRDTDVLLGLDPAERARLRQAVSEGWTLKAGTLQREAGLTNDRFEGAVEEGFALFALLRDLEANKERRWLARMVDDVHSEIRRRAFTRLTRDWAGRSGSASQAALVRAASGHPDPWIRVRMAELVDDQDALDALARSGLPEALTLLANDPRAAGRLPSILAIWLDTILPGLSDDATPAKRALAEALGTSVVAGGEAALIRFVGDGDEALRLRALRSLEAVGTVAAVPALLPLRDRFLGGDAKSAARDAITAIQARAAGAEVGALSLVAADGGELALAPDPD